MPIAIWAFQLHTHDLVLGYVGFVPPALTRSGATFKSFQTDRHSAKCICASMKYGNISLILNPKTNE